MAQSITQETWSRFQSLPDEDTFPKLLKRNYNKWGDKKVAYRYKDYGYWRELTWKDFYERTKWFAGGLASLGFGHGDRIAICGENAPEWFWGQTSAQSLGGASVGLYTDATPAELQFIIEHSDAKIVMVDDQEQVDKILSIKDQIPKVEKVIFWIAKGMWNYDDTYLIGFDDMMELGKEYEAAHPNFFDEYINKTKASDTAVLLYTSGTTGQPKGSIVTYGNLLNLFKGWDAAIPWSEKAENLSFLPPAWIGEQIFTVVPNLSKGVVVNFIEKAETVKSDLREIAPGVILLGARQWEMICSEIQAKMIDAPFWKRSLYNLFLPVGYTIAQKQQDRQKVGWLWRFLFFIGYWVVFRHLQDKIGMTKVKIPITAGTALSPDNFKLMRAIGVPIVQGYGSTEVSGVDVLQLENEYYRSEGSGQPFPGVEVRITEDGEILLGGVGVVQGYYKRPEETEKSFKNGYFHTGDGGYMDEEGELYIIDRVRDMQKLKSGEKFSPTYIEGRLKFSPFLKDAMVIGNDKDFVTAILNMDFENTGRWAERNHIAYTSLTEFSQKPEVRKLLSGIIQKTNTTLPETTRVKRFIVLHKDFDPDEAELTRTRKLRRDFVEKRYENIVEAMYQGKDVVDIETTITYRDGRKSTMKLPIYIESIQG
ncbi:MAG: AMP-binding protein [Syntrophobacterales bacterium]|nr:AMP-binding protein [Syntrophobacterales bacterium]